jgi:hypothetical protein
MLNSIAPVLMKLFFFHMNIITSFLYSTYSRGSSSSGRLTAEMLRSPSTILQQSGSTAEFPSLGDSRSSRDSTGEIQTPSARPMSMADVIKAQRQKRLMAAQQSSQIQPSMFKTPQRPANRGSFFQQYVYTQNKLLAYTQFHFINIHQKFQ